MLRIEERATPGPEDLDALIAPLDAFTRARGFRWEPRPLTLVLVDERGRILGGLAGETNWGWLHVRVLAVDESLRGRGWGTRLMARAEAEALARGCHHAWLDTFSFQARPFYERLGYEVFGTLPDYPAGQTRSFLSKRLGGEPTAGNEDAPPV